MNKVLIEASAEKSRLLLFSYENGNKAKFLTNKMR
jgi:hypothetical protein